MRYTYIYCCSIHITSNFTLRLEEYHKRNKVVLWYLHANLQFPAELGTFVLIKQLLSPFDCWYYQLLRENYQKMTIPFKMTTCYCVLFVPFGIACKELNQ